MNGSRSRGLARARVVAVIAGVALTACRGEPPTPSKPTPAATVAPAGEAGLTTVTLTADAARRLGIETASIEARGVTRTRTVGGEVVPAEGTRLTITAPVAGTLEGVVTTVGTTLARGTVVGRLVPLAPAERDARVEAERALQDATARQAVAAQHDGRARRLAADGAGSRRAADDAAAELAAANATLKAAQDRVALAARGVGSGGVISLRAPADAMLQAVHVASGQAVASSQPLFELVQLEGVWVRVPLYAGDLDRIDRRASAQIVPLGAVGTAPGVAARPIAGPPSAEPSTAAVDLYYVTDNRLGALRPGQRVGVRVPLSAPVTSLVVPKAALLHDATGGTWVYEARSSTVFTRRRVSVIDVAGDFAVLDAGPPAGTKVVTAGAAELFGTEFGVGK